MFKGVALGLFAQVFVQGSDHHVSHQRGTVFLEQISVEVSGVIDEAANRFDVAVGGELREPNEVAYNGHEGEDIRLIVVLRRDQFGDFVRSGQITHGTRLGQEIRA